MDRPPEQREPRRKKKKRATIRGSKITEPSAIRTDKRDYRPRLITGGKLPWDFSADNLSADEQHYK